MFASTFLNLLRRVRRLLPARGLGTEVLIVGVSDASDPASPRVFARQLSWLQRHCEVIPFSSLRDGRRGGHRPAAVLAFSGNRPALIRESLALVAKKGVPSTYFVAAPTPGDEGAGSWELLKALRTEGLIDIQGGAPPTADWHTAAPSEAAGQVIAAEQAIDANLGCRPDVFAAPDGFLPDAHWLAAFEGDARLARYRAFVWTASGVNRAAFQRSRSRHWARWPAPRGFGLRVRVTWKRPPRIAGYHDPAAKPAWYRGPARRAVLTPNPPVRQIESFLTVVHPFRSHHHSRDYLEYLYDRNPFRPEGVPAHYALTCDGVIEALLSAIGVPVREGGRVSEGIAISAWYRLPAVNHPLGAAPVVNAYLAGPHTVLCYDPSPFARAAFEGPGWLHFRAQWCAGPVTSQMTAVTAPGRALVERDTADGVAIALRQCWEQAAGRFDFVVERSPAYWQWKFGGNPLAPHRFFAWLVDGEPRAVCALGWENDRLVMSDLVYDPATQDLSRELERFLSSAFRRAVGVRPVREVCAETNQPEVLAALMRLGVVPLRETVLHWRQARGAAIPAGAAVYRSFADADFNLRPRA